MEQKRGKYVIPMGYVFRPEPEELLGFLVESIKLGDHWVRPPEIRNLDLYDKDSNPWTLFDEQRCYVMTRLRKMAAGNGRCNKKRTVGAIGTWKLQKSTDVAFRCQDGAKLKGLKRNFAFLPEKDCGYSREEHGHWIMNEYSILQHGFEDYVICEIHMKPSSKRKHAIYDTHKNQVVMKKIRSTTTTLSSTTTSATSDHDDDDGDGKGRVEVARDDDEYLQELVDQEVLMEKTESSTNTCDDDRKLLDLIESQVGVDDIVPNHDHQEVGMKKAESSTNTCDDDENRKLMDSIKSAVDEVMNDIVASRSLAPAPSLVADSDHDRQGMILIPSVDSYPSSSSSGDHDRDSVVKTDSCVSTKQSYPPPFDFPDDFWDFSGADLPAHWQEPAISTCDHHGDYLGSVIEDGSGLGFTFSGLDQVSPSLDFDFI